MDAREEIRKIVRESTEDQLVDLLATLREELREASRFNVELLASMEQVTSAMGQTT